MGCTRRAGRIGFGRRGEQGARLADAVYAEMLACCLRPVVHGYRSNLLAAEQLQRQRMACAELEQAGFVDFDIDRGNRADFIECM